MKLQHLHCVHMANNDRFSKSVRTRTHTRTKHPLNTENRIQRRMWWTPINSFLYFCEYIYIHMNIYSHTRVYYTQTLVCMFILVYCKDTQRCKMKASINRDVSLFVWHSLCPWAWPSERGLMSMCQSLLVFCVASRLTTCSSVRLLLLTLDCWPITICNTTH